MRIDCIFPICVGRKGDIGTVCSEGKIGTVKKAVG
jgi:hypothetical protein